MTWKAIYHEDTGELVSVTSEETTPPPPNGLNRKTINAPPTANQRWNTTTRTFDTIPEPAIVLKARRIRDGSNEVFTGPEQALIQAHIFLALR